MMLYLEKTQSPLYIISPVFVLDTAALGTIMMDDAMIRTLWCLQTDNAD